MLFLEVVTQISRHVIKMAIGFVLQLMPLFFVQYDIALLSCAISPTHNVVKAQSPTGVDR